MTTQNVWDKHAERALKSFKITSDHSNDPIRLWLKELSNKSSKKVLDMGSGIGQYLTYCRLIGYKNQIGVDSSKKAIEIAKKRGEKVVFGDLRDLPFESSSFDIVVAGGSMEHFKETNKAISEAARVLKKDGLLIGNVPYKYTTFVISKKLQQVLGLWKCGYEKSFTIRDFKKRLENNGFQVEKIRRQEIGGNGKVSKLLKIMDKPLVWLGMGGAHFYFSAKKR